MTDSEQVILDELQAEWTALARATLADAPPDVTAMSMLYCRTGERQADSTYFFNVGNERGAAWPGQPRDVMFATARSISPPARQASKRFVEDGLACPVVFRMRYDRATDSTEFGIEREDLYAAKFGGNEHAPPASQFWEERWVGPKTPRVPAQVQQEAIARLGTRWGSLAEEITRGLPDIGAVYLYAATRGQEKYAAACVEQNGRVVYAADLTGSTFDAEAWASRSTKTLGFILDDLAAAQAAMLTADLDPPLEARITVTNVQSRAGDLQLSYTPAVAPGEPLDGGLRAWLGDRTPA